jgi:hypothetical protein
MSLYDDYWNGKQQPLFREGSMGKSYIDPIDGSYLKQQRELGKMYEKSALNAISNGETVDTISIKHITTPEITDETYTIVKKANGEVFKRYLEGDKFIKFLSSLVFVRAGIPINLQERAIPKRRTVCIILPNTQTR